LFILNADTPSVVVLSVVAPLFEKKVLIRKIFIGIFL
jgi:hypothetical protein